MRWQFIPADPSSDDDFEARDRIRVDSFEGWESGLSYLSDIASWYADEDVREGYEFRVEGFAFKGRRSLDYREVVVAFESGPGVDGVRAHLATAWGPEGRILPPVGDPDVVRTARLV